MLRQSTGGGSGGGSAGAGSSGTKLSLGISRLSSSSLGSSGSARVTKSGSVSSDNPDVPASDPHYIMQLVSDVRKFADVLLQLKEVFNSKGTLEKECRRNTLRHRFSYTNRNSVWVNLLMMCFFKSCLLWTWAFSSFWIHFKIKPCCWAEWHKQSERCKRGERGFITECSCPSILVDTLLLSAQCT